MKRRPLVLSRFTIGAFSVEKREAMVWRLRADLIDAFGAAMFPSDFRRAAVSSDPRAPLEDLSMVISAQAIFLNSAAPIAALRSSISIAEHRSLWLPWTNLPLRSRSRPWKSRPNPARSNSSFLLRQNEKLILRSSSS